MDSSDIDGVRLFTAPGTGHVSVALAFGVGHSDETFATAGATHLVEHLVMGSLPRTHLECNAMVDVDQTTFYATGQPDAVRRFLEQVCVALSDLPLARLEQERGVIAAEHECGADPTAAALWAFRFGYTGAGLSLVRSDGSKLTPEMLRKHVATYFNRANAALGVLGEVPEGLRLPLPDGVPPARLGPRRRQQDGPVWTQGPAPGVGIMVAQGDPDDPAVRVGIDILERRLVEVARRKHGLTYSVSSEVVRQPHIVDHTLVLDARENQVGRVAGLVWQEFWALGETGPSAEDLEFAVSGMEEAAGSPQLAQDEIGTRLWMSVRQLRFRELADVAADWRAVTAADVAAAMRTARRTAVLMVPPDEAPDIGDGVPAPAEVLWCDGRSQLPRGRVYRPPVLARAFTRRARILLIIGDDGLGLQDADGDVHTVAWDDVVEVLEEDECATLRTVVGANLCLVPVDSDVFGKDAAADLERRLAGRPTLRPRVPTQRQEALEAAVAERA